MESLNLLKSIEFRVSVGGVKVKFTKRGVLVPQELFKEMMSMYFRVEQILATVETLADKEALRAIQKSREEVAKGKYVECSLEDLEKVLE